MIIWTRILRPRPMGRFFWLVSWVVGTDSSAGAGSVGGSAMLYSLPIRPSSHGDRRKVIAVSDNSAPFGSPRDPGTAGARVYVRRGCAQPCNHPFGFRTRDRSVTEGLKCAMSELGSPQPNGVEANGERLEGCRDFLSAACTAVGITANGAGQRVPTCYEVAAAGWAPLALTINEPACWRLQPRSAELPVAPRYDGRGAGGCPRARGKDGVHLHVCDYGFGFFPA